MTDTKEQKKMELTRKEALEQGYTKCAYSNDGWQALIDIEDLSDEDIGEGMFLAEKEEQSPGISDEMLKDVLAEHISCIHCYETGDDTDTVYDAVKEIDFSQTAEMINQALSSCVYRMITDIKLVP